MHNLRSVFSLLVLLVVIVGAPVLVSGCSGGAGTGETTVEANQDEQQQLHDQMQKGFVKRPVPRRR